ncbi:MAG: hypothetical protein B7Y99_08250 [Caulobacterales bacterium 32-69-10]|nr:MAG: hypothetical protein B7Y99_08250 [Caulobacterales bacterium 32-69-10]
MALAMTCAVGACATAAPMERAAGPGAYDIFCGVGDGASCYQRARAKCAAGQAVVTEQPSVKMRRDLRVVCKAG